jgi:hypothetical protein
MEIRKWVPIYGVWDISEDNAVYREPHPGLLSHIKLGLCISGFTFQGGRAAVTVTLPRTESGDILPDTAGQLLFGWRSPNEEYFAIGLGGHGAAFALTRYEPNQGWIPLAVVGTAKKSHSRAAI